MFLEPSVFETVIRSAPLISIDLVVEDSQGLFLLGWRKNRPAKDFWFVPGGRIKKNEKLQSAFHRITGSELGEVFRLEDAQFAGVFEHFYNDSVFGYDIDTHYVVLAYKLVVKTLKELPDEQHSCYKWFDAAQIGGEENIHPNTKAYFQDY